MPVTINGTTGVVTPGATIGSINGILKSSSGVVSQASVGTDYSQLTLATAQTASGTSVDFTGIPSWAKRITVMFRGLSLTTSDDILVRLGAGSSPVITGYTSGYGLIDGSNPTFASSSTTGFGVKLVSQSSNFHLCMNIQTIGNNIWISNHSGGSSSGYALSGGGSIALSGTLDRLQIIPTAGSFDAGTINISYE